MGGIYFHIPFCRRKCVYCNFFSVADLRSRARMVEAMAAELDTKVFRAWIREATVIKESQAVKQSLFAYAPSAKVAYDYRFFIEELLEDING